MSKNIVLVLSLCAIVIGHSNDANALDYTDPKSVSMVFLDALKHGNYEIVPSIVAPEYQLYFSSDALKKIRENVVIPDNLELKVNYKRNGKKAEVSVVGTKIGLELQLIEGRWLLEY